MRGRKAFFIFKPKLNPDIMKKSQNFYDWFHEGIEEVG